MKLRLLILVLTVAFSVSAQASAVSVDPVLLTIDLSDPSHAVITATGEFPETCDTTTQAGAGVDLESFLTSVTCDTSTGTDYCSSLVGATNSESYNSYTIDNASGCYKDLNLFVGGGSTESQHFTVSGSAFTGTMTVDLSSYICKLPSIGTTGDIIAGYSRGTNFTVLGLWEVVPEPSEYAMYIFLAFASLIVWRRISVSRQPVRI